METNSRNKYLLKNTIMFAIGSIGTKLISFFLVPLYTNVLSPAEYGIADLVYTIGIISIPILTLNIGEAIMRFALDKDADFDRIVNIGMIFMFIAVIVGAGVFYTQNIMEELNGYGIYIYLYVISLMVSQVFLYCLRGKEKLLEYSVGNIIQAIMLGVLNIVFLKICNMKLEGYFMSYIAANFVAAAYAFVSCKITTTFRGFRIDKKLCKSMLKYSIPLVPNSLMWWIMNSSDRLMVSYMIGVAANGIYAISSKLPTIISVIAGIFNQAWSYSAIREKGADDEAKYNTDMFKSLTGISILMGLGFLFIIKPLMKICVSDAYYEAWKYTPFLIIGCVYLALATFVATSYTVHKDSFGYLSSSIFGTVFNIVLNFVLIPLMGLQGAAVATCISYIAVFLFRICYTRKYIKYNLLHKKFIFGSILLWSSAIALFVDNIFGFILQFMLFGFGLCLFAKEWLPIINTAVGKLRKRG